MSQHPAVTFLDALGKQTVYIRNLVGKGYPEVELLKGKKGYKLAR